MSLIDWKATPLPVQGELFEEGFPCSDRPAITVLSFGAGQDSWALLVLLVLDERFRQKYAPGRLLVIFSDTGMEHSETYEALKDAKRFCVKYGIPFVHLKPGSEYHGKTWPSLEAQYNRNGTCGSKGFPRSCTDNLKIKPIYGFLEVVLFRLCGYRIGRKVGFYDYAAEHGRLRVIIGFAADEMGRMGGKGRSIWMRRTIEFRYPLIEIGAKRRDAQRIIAAYGFEPVWPSACRVCPFITLRDLLWKFVCRQKEYEELLHYENQKLERWKHVERNFGIFGEMRLGEALEKAQRLFGHMTPEELNRARMEDGHAVCSKY